MSDAPKIPFTARRNREVITREVDPAGRWSTQFPEMLGYRSQGGGKVPADLSWNTNPKQYQEEMTEDILRHERERPNPELPAGPTPQGTP